MENKQIEAQVGKVLSFKPRVGKVQMGQSTSGFISNSPNIKLLIPTSAKPKSSHPIKKC